RLVGMILTDTNDEWTIDERRYLSEGSMALLAAISDNQTIAAIPGSDQ
ncbi:IS256 family transposase, partial [Micropruina sp. KQZ13P-5]|nr:IS256 family transposase [Micropruina sp. KQZ13P-5]